MASTTAAAACEAKMKAAGVSLACITSFLSQHAAVSSGATGNIAEASIRPAADLEYLQKIEVAEKPELLQSTVVLKLNGGLGTGMGLDKAKSLLEVKNGDNFLDFIAKQILYFREQYKSNLKFMLMNSFSTNVDTKEYLSKYDTFRENFEEDVELLQNKVPKIRQDTFEPASCAVSEENEWVPPGHGDLYAALYGSGKLDRLIDAGYKYMFVSNSDNLGATMDLRILSHMQEKSLDFIMEVCERTESDKKGGHLAQDIATGKLLLRESAQCPKEDEGDFQNISKHRYFNTNNLWINLPSLKAAMEANNGMLSLPVIRNSKTVNPTDSSSTKVFQLETAMGTAITSFANASAIVVPRTRFAPVKTCNDLLSLRSDAYVITEDYRLVLAESRQGNPPVVALDDKHYKFVAGFNTLVEKGVPSLIACNRLKVTGSVQFDANVVLEGDVNITNTSTDTRSIASGTYTGDV
ncbi:UTP-glucose-1-phosphate uridylyltransferase, putative [Bodo saltans]|uniref:UTP--glucose-1-phosphate uridylyltransferase n=1 Tax=Bodo saltans TaxID=75058 RepID=A0A0S4JER9_BODSA|nr:UTP-glucose-1-phosphate uridylyltransferase, putative [Bodo saltans]|eukprot:CUG88789.1 UTP-glucose-1-phosphate uridylyltransferase, putative [Bodo saltans]